MCNGQPIAKASATAGNDALRVTLVKRRGVYAVRVAVSQALTVGAAVGGRHYAALRDAVDDIMSALDDWAELEEQDDPGDVAGDAALAHGEARGGFEIAHAK